MVGPAGVGVVESVTLGTQTLLAGEAVSRDPEDFTDVAVFCREKIINTPNSSIVVRFSFSPVEAPAQSAAVLITIRYGQCFHFIMSLIRSSSALY